MNRRLFLSAVVLIAATHVRAQAPAKRVAVLTAGDGSSVPPSLGNALRARLGSAGFVEGRNLALEWRFGPVDQLRTLADELARSRPDLIVAINTPAALAAKRATSEVPILFLRVADPVGAGLVRSLARPGGNATGLVPFTPELAGKRLAILKEAIPGVSKVAVLYISTNPGAALTFRQTLAAAPKLGMTILDAGVASSAGLVLAIEAAARDGAHAVVMVDDVVLGSNKPAIVAASLKHRLALSSIYRDFAESGALIAYGPNPEEMYVGAADYAERILRGAKPAELPVQQPSRFELIVNMKTAAAIGLTLSPAFLANADTVIR